MMKQTLAKSSGLLVLAFILAGDGAQKPAARDLVGPLLARVPQATAVLGFSGQGFPLRAEPLGQSDTALAADQRPARALDVQIPSASGSPFLVGSAGGRSRVPVKLARAQSAPLEVEAGRGVYRAVYEGVDVIAVRDPEYFELSFVVHEPASAPVLSFEVGSPESGERVSVEEGSGIAVVRSAAGTPLLHIEPPVAFDAAGARREGHYELAGSELSIALNLSELTPPIVIDPRFAIPFWTLLSNERAPGAVTYDKASGSREIRLAFDEARGRPVLIRPVRSQQREDSTASYAKLGFAQPGLRVAAPISSRLRQAPDGSVQAGPQETDAWLQSYFLQSETWEWNGVGWEPQPLTGLAGLIDPAVAYDRGRQRLVVTTGAGPHLFCTNDIIAVGAGGSTHCSLGQRDSTYELGPAGWSVSSIASPPPPRVRAALAPFPPHQVLFGGRALEPAPGFIVVEPYGPPYPDNLARGLLNDTWRYDGERWEHVPTANAPPARESAPMVFDERRHRLVLVGGTDAGFDLWEFDGTDWVERVPAGGMTLPLSLRGRKKMLAVWNPARHTTLLFGGIAAKLESCTLDDASIAVQRRDPLKLEDLSQAGCLGGYVHDMGATNITHFAPLNRDMWRYYHELALTQMAECRSYAEMPAAFYGNSNDVLPASQTEVHECERLAMAYEMFAQHFLQDAWSVGHMWNAWGATTLDAYPADVELLPNEAPLPAIDVPGRRALIGALVGIARGMVHGAKSFTVNLARDHVGSITTSVFERLGAFEDPLNGGRYTDLILVNHNLIPILRDVEWGDANDTARFPGAGDLYWDPLIRTGPVLSTQPELAVQRDRFMSCAAKSMLDVYLAGPRVHGETSASPPELAVVQVESDACWEHFAANDAMLAALNAFDSRYFNALLSLGGFLQVANSLFLKELGTVVDLTPGAATDTFLARVKHA